MKAASIQEFQGREISYKYLIREKYDKTLNIEIKQWILSILLIISSKVVGQFQGICFGRTLTLLGITDPILVLATELAAVWKKISAAK